MSKTHSRSTYYTPRQAAWILNADPAHVSCAIRRGALPTTRCRGRLVVSAGALARLLGEPLADGGHDPSGGGQW